MKKIALPVVGAIVFLALMLTFNFIVPTKVTATDEAITKLRIFDGNTGTETIITDEAQIETFVAMLNDITFLKSGVSLGYVGYSYDVTYYTANGDKVQRFIITNDETVRSNGFFYTAKNKKIDYEYVERMTTSNE